MRLTQTLMAFLLCHLMRCHHRRPGDALRGSCAAGCPQCPPRRPCGPAWHCAHARAGGARCGSDSGHCRQHGCRPGSDSQSVSTNVISILGPATFTTVNGSYSEVGRSLGVAPAEFSSVSCVWVAGPKQYASICANHLHGSAHLSESTRHSQSVLLSIDICVVLLMQRLYGPTVIGANNYGSRGAAGVDHCICIYFGSGKLRSWCMLPSISGGVAHDMFIDCSTHVTAVFLGCTRLPCIACLELLSPCD